MMRFLGGLALAVAALLGAYILEGGNVGALLGLSAFLITFLVPLFAVLAVWRWRDWLRAWSHAFRPGAREEAAVSVAIWKFSEFACYLAGILASLAGAVLVLQNWTTGNPDAALLARAVGALLVAPTYGIFFGLVCRILRARVESLNPGPSAG